MKIVETISISKHRSYTLTAYGVILTFIGAAIFQTLTTTTNQDTPFWALAVAFILTIIVHELLHGVGFIVGGAKPKFGVDTVGIMPVAYATSDSKLPLKNMLVVAYLPFISLSFLFVILSFIMPEYSTLFMVGFVGNFAGAIGDIWIASKMLKYLPFNDAQVLDTKTGTNIYSDDPIAAKLGVKSMNKENDATPFWRVAIITFAIIIFISAIVPTIMLWSGFVGYFKLGIGEFYLFMVNNSDTNMVAAFNLLPAIAGGCIAGAIFTVLQRR